MKSQLAYTLHKPIRLNFKTRPAGVHQVDDQWQIDLVDMSKPSKHNNGFKFIMVVIDILSNYAWLESPRFKHDVATKKTLEHIFSETTRRPKVIQMDKGTEFFNVLVKTYLGNNNIKLFAILNELKAQIIERLNRTIKGIMLRYFTKKNTRRYINIFQEIASKYNASYHRSIKMAPKDFNKDKETQVWINLYEKRISHKRRKKSKFSVGDFIRLSIEKAPFIKTHQKIWTEEVFIIDAIIYGNPTTYKMKDQDNEPIKGILYKQELLLTVEPKTYHIEKVIRKKKERDCLLLYVKWKGLSR